MLKTLGLIIMATDDGRNTTSTTFHCTRAADLALLSFLSEDVTDQGLLKSFLFDQEMPETSGWERLVVLGPERRNVEQDLIWMHSGRFNLNDTLGETPPDSPDVDEIR